MCSIHHLHYIPKTTLQSTIFQCAAVAAADGGFDGEVDDCGGDDGCVGVEDFDDFPSLGINIGSICRRCVSLCSFK
jgi:hypothetical protein